MKQTLFLSSVSFIPRFSYAIASTQEFNPKYPMPRCGSVGTLLQDNAGMQIGSAESLFWESLNQLDLTHFNCNCHFYAVNTIVHWNSRSELLGQLILDIKSSQSERVSSQRASQVISEDCLSSTSF